MRFIAGAILVLAGTILVSAAMIGIDVRNSTSNAAYTESRLGYYLGAAVAGVGVVIMALTYRSDR